MVLLVSKILGVAPCGKIYSAHFKGYVKGLRVDEVEFVSEEGLSLSLVYLVLLKDVKIKEGKLTGFALRQKALNEVLI